MKGELITVYVLYCGDEPQACFLRSSQARGYLENEILTQYKNHHRIHPRSGFRPDPKDGDGRIFLIQGDGPYELLVDYEPEEVKQERAAYRAAWEKLSPEERKILHLRDPV